MQGDSDRKSRNGPADTVVEMTPHRSAAELCTDGSAVAMESTHRFTTAELPSKITAFHQSSGHSPAGCSLGFKS